VQLAVGVVSCSVKSLLKRDAPILERLVDFTGLRIPLIYTQMIIYNKEKAS
jgi:hypothetical protein